MGLEAIQEMEEAKKRGEGPPLTDEEGHPPCLHFSGLCCRLGCGAFCSALKVQYMKQETLPSSECQC